MKTILILSLLFISLLIRVDGATIISTSDGDFNNTATWVGGVVPVTGDNVIIQHDVDLTIVPAGSFGTLSIDGASKAVFDIAAGLDVTFTDMTFNAPQTVLDIYGILRVSSITVNTNKSDVNVYASGEIHVSGNVSMTGPNQEFVVSNSGSASVGGDFLIDATNSSATISGSLDVAGTLTNNGTVTVPDGGTLDAGDYAGTTLPVSTGSGVILEGGNPLPIELNYFTAILNQNEVVINWQTATEENNDYFSIERSTNGYDFEEIATIAGAGNSSINLDYSYTDNNPKLGTSYYRLRQTDYDGDDEAFEIVSINNDASIALNKKLSVEWEDESMVINLDQQRSNLNIELFDVNGRIIESKQVSTSNRIEFETSFIPKGIYIVRVHDNAGLNYTEKVYLD